MQEAKTSTSAALNLIDESFDIKKSDSYHLSILSSSGHFTFAVLDPSANKYLALVISPTLNGQMNPQLFPHPGTGITWASVICAVSHKKFTLVPAAIFDDENKAAFFSFNHTIEKEETIHSDIFNNMDARNLYTVEAGFESMIRKYFINARIIHNSTSFIEGLLVQNKNNTKTKAFADFHSAYFEMVILTGRDLLFSNAFSCQSLEDIAYYILFVYEQLHLNPEEIDLTLSGEIEKIAGEHALLYNYIRHIKFASLPDSFKYSYKFNDTQPHRFMSLLNQYLCV
jgi:Protein of unknown function (DUF3822)